MGTVYREVDKFYHFVVGIVIACLTLAACHLLQSYFNIDLPHFELLSEVTALVITIAIAYAKEWRDAQGYGTPDAMDFIITVLGCVAVLSVL